MRITTIAALASMVTLAAPLAAQSQNNIRVLQAMTPAGNKYIAPFCELKGSNFKTSSSGVAIKTASEGGFSSSQDGRTQVDKKKYMDLVTRAGSVASEVVAADPNSAAGWYWVGRSALMLGNIQVADSAFTQLEKVSPGCAEEVKGYRQRAWLVLVNPSTAFLQNKQYDSAVAVLRDANLIARYYPQGYYNLGAAFANMTPTRTDSAIYYFKLAIDKAGSDPSLVGTAKSATQNIGFLYSAAKDYPNAVIWFRKYLVMDPAAEDVKRSLAVALNATGNTAEATQIENQLMSSGSLSSNEIAGRGVRLFNDKDYAGAAEAFKKILVIEPGNHDAMSNLANSYLALNDGKNLLDASKQLMAVDPLSENNMKLLANAYRLMADTTKWLGVVTDLQAMTTKVSVTSFAQGKDGAKFVGVATGSEGRNANDKLIPPTAITLVFDFMNAKGEVVATKEVPVAALAPNAKADLVVDGAGPGIVAWKYHKK